MWQHVEWFVVGHADLAHTLGLCISTVAWGLMMLLVWRDGLARERRTVRALIDRIAYLEDQVEWWEKHHGR